MSQPTIYPDCICVVHLVVAELPQARERTPIKDRSSLQDCNDLIPDELLATLTSTACPQDRLAPLRLTKTPKDFKVLGTSISVPYNLFLHCRK